MTLNHSDCTAEHDPLPPSLLPAYDAAAEYCAARGIVALYEDQLPEHLAPAVWDAIVFDLDAFNEHVRMTAYARAMEGKYACEECGGTGESGTREEDGAPLVCFTCHPYTRKGHEPWRR